MLGRLLLVSLLAGLTLQQCTIGCLKCNGNNQCVLCDVTNQYYLVGSACVLSTLQNCKLIALNGNCVQCASNFYLDPNAQRCVAVTNSSIIANCVNYASTGFCSACSGAFVLTNGACVAVNTTIANCGTYSANGVCAACNTGYLLSNDFSGCVAVPTTANCMFYSYVSCQRCKTGFINNPNYYFTNFNTVSYIYSQYLSTAVIPNANWIQLSQCQPIVATNCLAWSAFDTCTQCAAGYFLSGKNCVAFPLPVINNCIAYSTLTTCTQCTAGYFLSSNACILNTVIANCLTYSGSATTTTCLACNTGLYLQGNVCVNRTLSAAINNCQTVSVAADTCAACATGFVLTTDGRACLTALANCAQYGSSTFQTSALQCALCNPGFYVTSSGSASICAAGTIANCAVYQVNANTCTACANGYYLSGNACLQHVSIANCVTYDATKANYCSVCASGYYNFAYTTVCVQVSQKTNCVAYSFDGSICTACAAGYYLNSGSCAIIPSSFANCAVYSGTQCTLCNTGYMINSLPTVGTCILPLDYIIAATNSPCAVNQTLASTLTATWTGSPSVSQSVLTCATCNDYMYGYNPQGAEAICISTSQLTLFSGFTAVSNCLRYGLSYAAARPIVCMQCASGWFISGWHLLIETTAATTCVSTCTLATTASPAVVPDDMLGFVNICAPAGATTPWFDAIGTCARYGRYRVLNLGAAATTDYFCFLPTSYQTSPPTNALLYTVADTIGYYFENPSATAVAERDNYYGVGYTITVDSTSLAPQVFNYAGLLASPYYLGVGANLITLQAALGSTNVNRINSLNNCDIVAQHSPTISGSVYDTTAPASTFYTAAVTAQVYSCFRCQFGYQLSFTAGTTVATNLAAPACVQMSTCASSTTVYGGLTQFLNSILSCHVCSQGTGAALFPTIFIETGGMAANARFGTWLGFQAGNVYSGTAPSFTVAARSGFKCATAPSTVVIADTPTSGSVSNCAVYGNIRPLTTLYDTTPTTPVGAYNDVCLACAANYWPTYLGTWTAAAGATNSWGTTSKLPNWVVTGCTPSLNCDTTYTTQFNSCGKCRTDQDDLVSAQYYAFHDMTLSNCFRSASRNCFILDTASFSSGATTNACGICKSGYFMNSDSQCEVYRVPNENVNTGIFVNAYVASKVYPSGTATTPSAALASRYSRAHYLLSYKQLQYGVSSCSSGYSLMPANPWAPRLCVWSSYVYNYTGSFPAASNFITNCVRYNLTQVSSKNVCGGCLTGFIPVIDGTSCVTSVANCQFAQTGSNSGLCYQCAVNYNNVNGVCTLATIPSCAAYVNTRWSFTTPSTLTCSKCQDTFSLSADGLTCSPGRIANCIQYAQGSTNQCTTCTAGFVLLTLANNVYYCYPFPATLNCALLQDTSGTSGANYGTISCAQCNQGQSLVYGGRQWSALGNNAQAQTLCMPFSPILNCVAYNQGNAIINQNSFACTQCSSGFYYSAASQACVARTKVPSACSAYSNTADVCTACASGFFLSADATNCVAFPNGIFQCARYSSATNCTQCNAGYYLFNNLCLASTAIPNCAVYTANYTCSACNSGFFLQNSTSCVTATATNCLTYTSMTACATCATGFGLQTTNAITSCVAVNLANCASATQVSPFTCLTCNAGFFPNANGVCTAVSTTIANCLTYDTATTCTNCTAGTVLNVARTVCNATFYTTLLDPNCQSSVLLAQPACVQCNAGSLFANNTCVACSSNVIASGCLSCDPTNQTSCLVCAPTYYMNNQGACIANNPTPNPNPNPSPNPNATATLTKAMSLAVAVAAVYFEWA